MILSIFPSLLDFPLLGIFIIRFVLGLIFVHLGYTIVFSLGRSETWIKVSGYVTLLTGLLLVVGLFTQVAALIAALLAILATIIKIRRPGPALEQGVSHYLILLAVALALLTLGPGTFAIDLPL